MNQRRPVHILAYGQPGTGKSSLAATFPKPMVVFNTDGPDKIVPYLEQGRILKEDDNQVLVGDADGKLLIQIEHFHDDELEMKKSSARDKLFKRLAAFHHEYAKWTTVVFDSITSLELIMRKYAEYVTNPLSSRPDLWYADSAYDLEDLFVWRLPRWRMNVVAIAHEDEVSEAVMGQNGKPTGERRIIGYRPAAPGKIGNYKAASSFGEFYRVYTGRELVNGKQRTVYRLQTEPRPKYPACTRIHAPDGAEANYEALWTAHAQAGSGTQD